MTLPEFSHLSPIELPMDNRLRMLDEVEAVSHEPDYYRQFVPLARILLSARYQNIVEGLENIPSQPSLFVINHIKAADSIIVPSVVTPHTGLPLRMVAKQEYFAGDGLDGKGKFGKPIKWFMKNTGQIEVDRDLTNPRAVMALGPQIDAIINGAGEHVGIHGEGTRKDNGYVNKFFNSIGRWSYDYSIPIVPVGIHYYNPRGVLGRTPVTTRFGEALMPESYYEEGGLIASTPGTSRKAQLITDEIERRVSFLAGMPQSHEFAFIRSDSSRSTEDK